MFVIGCKKDPSFIGLNIHPDSKKYKVYVDSSIVLKTYTITENDTIYANTSTTLLGSLNDPIFGISKASIITQIRPYSSNVDFTNVENIDSVFLELDLMNYSSSSNNYYGDTISQLEISVYEITQNIEDASTRLHPDTFDIDSYLANSLLIEPFNFALEPNSDNSVKIPLTNEFGDILIKYSDTTDFETDSAFSEYFNGIYVTTNEATDNGIMLYLNLVTNSKITIYYTVFGDTIQKSFIFNIDNYSKRYNIFEHNHPESLHVNDTSSEDSVVYIKAMQGLKTKIILPDISNWLDSGLIIINKAEFVMQLENSELTYQSIFPIPNQLILAKLDDEGKEIYANDFTSTDGYIDDSYYKFNISNLFQNYVDGETELKELYLKPYPTSIIANRAIIKGGSHKDKMKLYITYSKLFN